MKMRGGGKKEKGQIGISPHLSTEEFRTPFSTAMKILLAKMEILAVF